MDHQSSAGNAGAKTVHTPSPSHHTHTDPATGDTLTTGEWISWHVQGIIRRWTFLILITAVTIMVWSTNSTVALQWWNLGASYLALVIESIVGIAMFSQTRRDAVVLREVRALDQKIERQDTVMLQIVEHLDAKAGGDVSYSAT